jgi:hypothetical protein
MRALASAAVCAEVALREGGEGGGHALRGGALQVSVEIIKMLPPPRHLLVLKYLALLVLKYLGSVCGGGDKGGRVASQCQGRGVTVDNKYAFSSSPPSGRAP